MKRFLYLLSLFIGGALLPLLFIGFFKLLEYVIKYISSSNFEYWTFIGLLAWSIVQGLWTVFCFKD